MTQSWIPLTEYSNKYRVSISTLRRRIKAEDIQYSFREGKYLILDEPLSTHPAEVEQHRPSLTAESPSQGKTFSPAVGAQSEEPILTAANRLLSELKKAYSQILHEKEEQIQGLKEEVADLKTLVRVLESENERLQKTYNR